MIKKRRLSEGVSDVIWLDDIDRIHPEGSSREILEHVEEEADPDMYINYDEIKDIKELERLVGGQKIDFFCILIFLFQTHRNFYEK